MDFHFNKTWKTHVGLLLAYDAKTERRLMTTRKYISVNIIRNLNIILHNLENN